MNEEQDARLRTLVQAVNQLVIVQAQHEVLLRKVLAILELMVMNHGDV